MILNAGTDSFGPDTNGPLATRGHSLAPADANGNDTLDLLAVGVPTTSLPVS